jgi:transposase
VSTKRWWTLFVMSAQKQEGNIVDGERRRRRAWSDEEKRRIVAETLEPGASVSIVARRHDINANQLFTWRRTVAATPSAAEGEATRLVPAVVTPESPAVWPRPNIRVTRRNVAADPGCSGILATAPTASASRNARSSQRLRDGPRARIRAGSDLQDPRGTPAFKAVSGVV